MDMEERIPPIDINLRVINLSKKDSKKLNKKISKRENLAELLFTHYLQSKTDKKD